MADCARQEYAQGDLYLLVHALAALGTVAVQERDAARAAQVYGAVEALLARMGTQLDPSDYAGYERYLAIARGGVGEETFAANWATGRTMPLEEAVAFACEPAASTSIE